MPSRKVISASLQQPLQRTRPQRGKSAYRISSSPEDAQAQKLQDDARASLDAFLAGTPFRNGVLKSGTFGTDENDIEHGLGGPARFIVVGLKPITNPPAVPPVVYEVTQTSGARYDTHIRLACTEPADVTLWIWRAEGDVQS